MKPPQIAIVLFSVLVLGLASYMGWTLNDLKRLNEAQNPCFISQAHRDQAATWGSTYAGSKVCERSRRVGSEVLCPTGLKGTERRFRTESFQSCIARMANEHDRIRPKLDRFRKQSQHTGLFISQTATLYSQMYAWRKSADMRYAGSMLWQDLCDLLKHEKPEHAEKPFGKFAVPDAIRRSLNCAAGSPPAELDWVKDGG